MDYVTVGCTIDVFGIPGDDTAREAHDRPMARPGETRREEGGRQTNTKALVKGDGGMSDGGVRVPPI